MKQKFLITGQRPFPSRRANLILKAMDFGIEAAVIPYTAFATVTYDHNPTKETIAGTASALEDAYTQQGFYSMRVIPFGEVTK